MVTRDTTTYRIKGIIKNIEFQERQTKATSDPGEPYLPGREQWMDVPARFKVTVQIQEVTNSNKGKDERSDKMQYKIGNEFIFFINQSKIKVDDGLQVGQIIVGMIADGYFKSYELATT